MVKESREVEEGQIMHPGICWPPNSVMPKANVSNVFQFQESISLPSLYFLAHLFELVVSINNQISSDEYHLKTAQVDCPNQCDQSWTRIPLPRKTYS